VKAKPLPLITLMTLICADQKLPKPPKIAKESKMKNCALSTISGMAETLSAIFGNFGIYGNAVIRVPPW